MRIVRRRGRREDTEIQMSLQIRTHLHQRHAGTNEGDLRDILAQNVDDWEGDDQSNHATVAVAAPAWPRASISPRQETISLVRLCEKRCTPSGKHNPNHDSSKEKGKEIGRVQKADLTEPFVSQVFYSSAKSHCPMLGFGSGIVVGFLELGRI